MNLLKVSILSFFVFFSFTTTFVNAEVFTNSVEGDARLIANVSLYNATLVSQEENKLNLSFEVVNKGEPQAGLHYEIQLIKQTKEKGQFLADKYVSPDLFSLNKNQSINKEVTYTAPSQLNGEYKLLISVNNKTGLMLALGFTNDVTLTSSNNFLMIQTESCYLTVKGEKDNPKYNLAQGVDIDSSEDLILNCSVENNTDRDIVATPSYETRLRTEAGGVVSQEGGDVNEMTFKANESKGISLTIPKALKPQAYDLVFTLNGNEISNKIVAHYVIRGVSATIQNFSIDKDSYKKGETATLNLSWTPSADSFFGNRQKNNGTEISTINLNLEISSNGKACIEPINQNIQYKDSGLLNLPTEIIRNCNSPKATITLSDTNGEILDTKEISFGVNEINKNNMMIIYIFGGIIIIGLVMYFISLNKKENETTI